MKGFSLIELLISLIIISLITAAFTPVISKKLKNSSVSLAHISETTEEEAEIKCEGGYYLKDKECVICPSEGCCDGISIYTTIPAGYYCDSNILKKCSEKYGSSCAACTDSACTTCSAYNYLKDGKCASCELNACTQCLNNNYCTECYDNWLLNTTTHRCALTCESVMAGCISCKGTLYGNNTANSDVACTACNGEYYINSKRTCSLCTIANCQKCKDNQQEETCEMCSGGYFLKNKTCTSCRIYDSNCVSCNTKECLSCKEGYFWNGSSCEANDNQFKCSDSNFMQIGSLCVTRKNMGDSATLSIPSTVTVVNANEYCYSTNDKCCWKGSTATSGCNSENGSYTGCTRTVCNWEAANEICSKFTYQGKKWRLAQVEEMSNWGENSFGLKDDGLMLCDNYSGYLSSVCNGAFACQGSSDNGCRISYLWSAKRSSTLVSWGYYINKGNYSKAVEAANLHPFSVRCVTEI